jgi:hypothetical protein
VVLGLDGMMALCDEHSALLSRLESFQLNGIEVDL